MVKRLIALVLITSVFQLTVPVSVYADAKVKSDRQLARHLLNRIAYGPRKGDIENLLSKGVDQYLNEQLNPRSIHEPPQLKKLASKSAALTNTPAQMFLKYGKPQMMMLAGLKGKNKRRDLKDPKVKAQLEAIKKQNRQNRRMLYREITDHRLMRAVYSPRQLQEVLTEFWFNHFNVTYDKGLDYLWVGSYENQAIRPHVLGRFRDLLGATAHHAAMLFYLDNWQNTTESAAYDRRGRKKKKRGKFRGINENYARELMELHTMGVDGGYTQTDVVALAKILTGHGIQNRRSLMVTGVGAESVNGYFFDSRRHDYSDKLFLGHRIKGTGKAEINQALDILSKHPSTARHISFKLAQYFVSDKPPEKLVKKLSRTYLKTDGNIKAVMAELLDSDEFWSKENVSSKYKTPYRYVVSSLRATDAIVLKSRPIVGFLHIQGMPMYRCLTPDGYKNTEKAWLHPNGLIQRIEFATILASGRHPAAKPREKSLPRLLDIAGIPSQSKTGQVIRNSNNRLKMALAIGSPEFMKH